MYSFECKEMKYGMGVGAIYETDGETYIAIEQFPRKVRLDITSWIGTSPGATHYYGTINVSDLSFKEQNTKDSCISFCGYVDKNYPDSVRGVKLELTRKLSKKDLKTERFHDYRLNEVTECFNTKEELLEVAIKEYHRIFCQDGCGWVFEIDDHTI